MEIESFKYKFQELLDKYLYLDRQLFNLSEVLKFGGKDHESSPGTFKEEVDCKNKGETAYQRAIILSGQSKIEGLADVKWVDIELPVIFGCSARRRSLDLLGQVGDENILVELKYDEKVQKRKSKAKPNTNSPLYAFFEILIYYFHISRNAEALQKDQIWHQNRRGEWSWESCKTNEIYLIVAANKNYWEKWKSCKVWESLREGILDVTSEISPIHVDFFISPDPDESFDQQSRNARADGKNRYTPLLGNNSNKPWQKVILK